MAALLIIIKTYLLLDFFSAEVRGLLLGSIASIVIVMYIYTLPHPAGWGIAQSTDPSSAQEFFVRSKNQREILAYTFQGFGSNTVQ